MGYVMVFGLCCSCDKLIGFNPNKVPSVRIMGEKRPICRECVERVNTKRRVMKMPQIEIDPEAYESANEDEIAWE